MLLFIAKVQKNSQGRKGGIFEKKYYLCSLNKKSFEMKRLIVKNFGPIKECELNLGTVNVITGLQSSGKSCILKIASYCSFIEKSLSLDRKISGEDFINILISYYNIGGYIKNSTYVEYETLFLRFVYDNSLKEFFVEWKEERLNYKRRKVSYIPADRNLVASLSSWENLRVLDGNLLDFMTDWDKARKFIKKEDNFLNLGMSYSYEEFSGGDNIELKNGHSLKLKDSSSGIQSLLPMYVHLDYLFNGQYEDKEKAWSLFEKQEYEKLRELYADKADNFINTNHSEIFLEEPENNLFPPTQCKFVDWLIEGAEKHDDFLFIATHSPYVLNHLVKRNPKDLKVMFTYPCDDIENTYSIKELSAEEVEEMYFNGVDMFFNFEMFL